MSLWSENLGVRILHLKLILICKVFNSRTSSSSLIKIILLWLHLDSKILCNHRNPIAMINLNQVNHSLKGIPFSSSLCRRCSKLFTIMSLWNLFKWGKRHLNIDKRKRRNSSADYTRINKYPLALINQKSSNSRSGYKWNMRRSRRRKSN